MSNSKQLAAIMVTGLLDQGAENQPGQGASGQLAEEYALIQKPLVSKHRGRWIRGLDGSSFAAFDSSIDAVNCSRELQSICEEKGIKAGIHIQLAEVAVMEDGSEDGVIQIDSDIDNTINKEGILVSESIFHTIRHNKELGLAPVSSASSKPKEASAKEEDEELSMDQALLRKLREVVEENLTNEQFGVEDLANEVAISRSHLHRKLSQLTGESISLFIRGIRLDNAMELLRKDVATVSEISYRVGFGSPTYFIKCFHEHFGYPPGEVKKRLNEQIVGGAIEAEAVGIDENTSAYEVKATWDENSAFRQLVAIVITEISGYDTMVSQDEMLGARVLEASRHFQQPLIDEYHGKMIGEGDQKTTISFPNTLDAVNYSMDLQGRTRKHPFLRLKCAVHLGDVLFQNNNVAGEGINIASQLLPMCVPGGVLVSQKVQDELGGNQDIHTHFLGNVNLENLQRPLSVHALVNEGLMVPDQIESSTKPKPSAFDALQPYTTQKLIRSLFDEMVKYKPMLEKYTMVDEELEEEIDTRLLAYQIIKNFPWPIGIELRRLFSGSLRQLSQARQEQLQITTEQCVRLLCFMLLSEWTDLTLAKKAPGIVGAAEHLDGFDFKASCWFIRQMCTAHEQVKGNFFVEELFVDKDLMEVVDRTEELTALYSDRNLDQEGIRQACRDLESNLAELLKKMACLVKYRLVNIGMIKVEKSRFSQVQFRHYMDLLNSTDAEFKTFEQQLEEFSDSNAVLLLKSLKEPGEFINLSPLVVDTHHMEIRQEEHGAKQDIFLFSGYSDGKLQFSGCEVTDATDLSGLPAYKVWEEEYKQLKEILNNG